MDYDHLLVSDGTGDAALMHISADRDVGNTTIEVDTVSGVDAKFIGTSGTLLATGFIDPTTKTDFLGHIDGSNLAIDSFEPGSSDIGNTEGQIVIIKPNTGWANRVAGFIQNATGNGTPENHTVAGLTASSIVTSAGITVGGNEAVTGTFAVTGAMSGNGYSTKTIANPYKFSVYRNSAANTGNNTLALITFDTALFDTSSNYSLSTGKFTAPINGFYQFSFASGFIASAGFCVLSLFKNGTEYHRGSEFISAGSTDTQLVGSALVELETGDYVQIFVQSPSTNPLSVGSTARNYFTGFLVSAT